MLRLIILSNFSQYPYALYLEPFFLLNKLQRNSKSWSYILLLGIGLGIGIGAKFLLIALSLFARPPFFQRLIFFDIYLQDMRALELTFYV